MAFHLGGYQPVLEGGQQLLGFLHAQAQLSQGQLVRPIQGEKIVFGDCPGSGLSNEFDGPLHGREPRPRPTYHNSLCSRFRLSDAAVDKQKPAHVLSEHFGELLAYVTWNWISRGQHLQH
jgi:hypothetical protein